MNLLTIKKMRGLLRSAASARRKAGTVAMEFALTLPIWILLLVGTADAALMMIMTQRVDRIAYSVTDIVTQSEVVTTADLNNILLAASQLMEPFPFGEDGVVIVSSVYKPAGLPQKINWQHIGGGSLPRDSKLGITGSTPVLPGGLTLSDNENVIVSEVFYYFRPMFINAGILSEGDVYRAAVYKPRLSPLVTPPT